MFLKKGQKPLPDKQKKFTVRAVIVSNVISGMSSLVSINNLQTINTDETGNDSFPRALIIPDDNYSKTQVADLQNRLTKSGYTTQSFQNISDVIHTTIATVQIGLSIFSSIAILAATLGIINTLLMAVLERRQEIGLMKALGMGGGGIYSLFAIEAAFIGFWGGIIGVGLAVSAGYLLNRFILPHFIKGLDGYTLLLFPISSCFAIVVINMLIAFLAGTLPAIKASRMNPIEALRTE